MKIENDFDIVTMLRKEENPSGNFSKTILGRKKTKTALVELKKYFLEGVFNNEEIIKTSKRLFVDCFINSKCLPIFSPVTKYPAPDVILIYGLKWFRD